MMSKELKIYYEDKDIIVVHKPAFVSSQGARGSEIDMESMIRNHLYMTDKKANPYVAVVHRLDKPVEGIMVYAKSKKAAAGLSTQIQSHSFKKSYVAVVGGNPDNKEYIRIENYLVKDGAKNMSFVADKSHKEAKKAIFEYKYIGENKDGYKVLKIKLHTGRHHQIRVTLSNLGYPIVGDSKYGDGAGAGKLMLCACEIEFKHPVSGKAMAFHCDINSDIYGVE